MKTRMKKAGAYLFYSFASILALIFIFSSIGTAPIAKANSTKESNADEALRLYENWEYLVPEYIIKEVTIPLSYSNPWYVQESKAGETAVKDYYYLGTVIYNDTTVIGEKVSSIDELNDEERIIYNKLLKLYHKIYQKCKSNTKRFGSNSKLWKKNAAMAIVQQGVKDHSNQLPFIYEVITKEKFDWAYWNEEGIDGLSIYKNYGSDKYIKTTIHKGIVSNYAKSVKVSGYDSSVVRVYQVTIGGEARVYVKGKKQGSTTLTITTQLNDGTAVTYSTKVTIASSSSPVQYKTDVNPLSYDGYCINKYGYEYLGYMDVNALVGKKSFSDGYNHSGDEIQLYGDPKIYLKNYSLDGLDEIDQFCKCADILSDILLERWNARFTGLTGDEYWAALDKELETLGPAHHTSLEEYLNSANCVCEDMTAVWNGIAKYLNLKYKNFYYPNHVWIVLLADGKIYEFTTAECAGFTNVEDYDLRSDKCKVMNDAKLSDLLNGTYTLGVYATCKDGTLYSQLPGISWEDYFHNYVSRPTDTILGDSKIFVLEGEKYYLGDTIETTDPEVLKLFYDYYYLDEVKMIENANDASSVGSNYVLLTVRDQYSALQSANYIKLDSLTNTEGRDLKVSLDMKQLITGSDTNILTLSAQKYFGYADTPDKFNNSFSFTYQIPYVEKAYFDGQKSGSKQQLLLVNSDWSDWTVKSSKTSVATISSSGVVTMNGKGTASITLTSKSVKGLKIKVLVSTGKIKESDLKEYEEQKVGTFYNDIAVLSYDYKRTDQINKR